MKKALGVIAAVVLISQLTLAGPALSVESSVVGSEVSGGLGLDGSGEKGSLVDEGVGARSNEASNALVERLIVRYESGVSPLNSSGEPTGSKSVGVDLGVGKKIGFGFRTVVLPEAVSAAEASLIADELESSSLVRSVEVDQPVYLDDVIVSQALQVAAPSWGLDRIDQVSLPLDGNYGYGVAGTGVDAYIIDSGINTSHQEFTERIGSGLDSVGDGRGVEDCDGHGTHVAGTVGGRTYGVAKKVQLIPVRVFDCDGGAYTSTIVTAIDWVVGEHVAGQPAVANLSLGGGYSTAMNTAIQSLVNDGIVAVVASGNESTDACYVSPASAPAAITVNASTIFDDDADYSNFGSCTDIYAPGSAVKSAWIDGISATATISGTSMASPHVAGAAARILSENPSLTPAEVWAKIEAQATAVDFYPEEPTDAKLLLYMPTQGVPGAVSNVSSTNKATSMEVSWDAVAEDGGAAVNGYLVNAYSSSTSSTVLDSCVVVGTDRTCELASVSKGTVYYIGVAASNSNGQGQFSSPRLEATFADEFIDAPVPTISGTATVGQVLTLNKGTWLPTPSAFGYQWLRDDVAIAGAIGTSYTLQTLDRGSVIKVRVTGSKLAYTTKAVESLGTLAVTSAFTSTRTPTISGTLTVGSLLTVSTGTWSPNPSFSYQWYAGTEPIALATESTFRLTSSQLGSSIKVRVEGTLTGYTPTAVFSNSSSAVRSGTMTLTPTPVIVGSPVIGDTLTVAAGTWDVGTTLSYVWKRGSTTVGTTNSYTVLASDRGSSFTVAVTGTKTGYTSVTKTSSSSAKAVGPFVSVVTPTITGLLAVGSVLTAIPGSWSPSARFSYQWLRDDEVISRATSSKYTLVSADSGKRMSVRVTGTATNTQTQTVASTQTDLVKAKFTSSPVPVISGTAQVGNTLTASYGTWSPSATLDTQWLANGVVIDGATSGTFVLTSAQLGKQISVRVTGSAVGVATTTLVSRTTSSVRVGVLTLTPVPTISGTTIVGQTLTANEGTWDDGVSFAYQWKRGRTIVGTSKTYTLLTADRGFTLTVTVTGSKAGYTSAARTSSSSTSIAATSTSGIKSLSVSSGLLGQLWLK